MRDLRYEERQTNWTIARGEGKNCVNARAPRYPVVTLTATDRGPPHAGSTRAAVRLATAKGTIVVPWNSIFVRPVKIAVVMKGSEMKRMTSVVRVGRGGRKKGSMWQAQSKRQAENLPGSQCECPPSRRLRNKQRERTRSYNIRPTRLQRS